MQSTANFHKKKRAKVGRSRDTFKTTESSRNVFRAIKWHFGGIVIIIQGTAPINATPAPSSVAGHQLGSRPLTQLAAIFLSPPPPPPPPLHFVKGQEMYGAEPLSEGVKHPPTRPVPNPLTGRVHFQGVGPWAATGKKKKKKKVDDFFRRPKGSVTVINQSTDYFLFSYANFGRKGIFSFKRKGATIDASF